MKTGNVYCLCRKDNWTGEINKDCFIYMVARAGAAGSFRAMCFLAPRDYSERADLWNAIHDYSLGKAFAYLPTEGSISMYTFRKKDWKGECYDSKGYVHVSLGNVQEGLRGMGKHGI